MHPVGFIIRNAGSISIRLKMVHGLSINNRYYWESYVKHKYVHSIGKYSFVLLQQAVQYILVDR